MTRPIMVAGVSVLIGIIAGPSVIAGALWVVAVLTMALGVWP